MKMQSHLIKWLIDIDAPSPQEATERARAIQLDPESLATVFEVCDPDGMALEQIDLNPRT